MPVPEVSGASPRPLSSGAGVRRRSMGPGWSRSMKTSGVTPRLGLVSGKLNFFLEPIFFCGLECVLFATFSKGTGENTLKILTLNSKYNDITIVQGYVTKSYTYICSSDTILAIQ
jgi:hypothetical protein